MSDKIPRFTGLKRYRVQKRMFRKSLVVLQLQVEGFVPEYDVPSIGGEIRKYWIDASTEHITEATQ